MSERRAELPFVSHVLYLSQVFINCLEQLSTKTDAFDSTQWVFGRMCFVFVVVFFIYITDNGLLKTDNTLQYVLCVQGYFRGAFLAGSIFCHPGGLLSSTCKRDAFAFSLKKKCISLKQLRVITAEILHLESGSITKVWALGFTQTDKHISLIQTTKCYQAVSWLWTRSRYILISCNLLEMLV